MIGEGVPAKSDKVIDLGSAKRQIHHQFDPVTAPTSEVIARALIDADHLKMSIDAALYLRYLLDTKEPDVKRREIDQLMRERLRRELGRASNDDRWEDEDEVAAAIYDLLRDTIDESIEYHDARAAVQKLLLLRGVDLESDPADPHNAERFIRVVRKLGQKGIDA